MSKGPGNPYHDKEGKFSSGPSSASSGNRSVAKKIKAQHVPKPSTEKEKQDIQELMAKTRGVSLYESLSGKQVYEMPWHPLTKIRVLK